MAGKSLGVGKHKEIKRLLEMGLKQRQIARALGCSRNTVRKIQMGEYQDPNKDKPISGPLWAVEINWEKIKELVNKGHPLKFIWSDFVSSKTSYINFWRYFSKTYPEYQQISCVHRVFEPGTHAEVDYAGKKEKNKIEWVDIKTGEVHEVEVFVGILCHSQYIFATARNDQKLNSFLDCHREMYENFGGVPRITVPDNLKSGVTKTHLYDPDVNPSYTELATYYGTAIVPARPRKPKDKSLTENGVNLVMSLFRWKYRDHVFTSPGEIREALKNVTDQINSREHTRLKKTRFQMLLEEREYLKPLPKAPYEACHWKEAKVHPDCHISLESNYYSVPFTLRGKQVKVKYSLRQVEIFYNLDRVALHKRCRDKCGKYITNKNHLPPNAKAYYEMTPQNLLSQTKYIHAELYKLADELFKEDALFWLRKVQGFIREAKKEINTYGFDKADKTISRACKTMTVYAKYRVPYFRELLNHYRKEVIVLQDREIVRLPDNPMLRYSKQEKVGQLILLTKERG